MTPYAATNPPRETDWGLVWTGVWGDVRVRLFLFRRDGHGVVESEHWTHAVCLSGESDLVIGTRRVRALHNVVHTIQPGVRQQVVLRGEDPAHWLMWYPEKTP